MASEAADSSESVIVPNPSICQTCDQPLSSDVCPLCNTVPKDFVDVNSNEINTSANHLIQDSINKLETCLINSIADRKLFEDSISQRLSALEAKPNSCKHVCDISSTVEGRRLREDIVRLEGVKCQLEREVKSLQEKLEELASYVHIQSSKTPIELKSMETQTTDNQSMDQDSDRADKLIHEVVATVNVQNRFEVLDKVSDHPDSDSSHMLSKQGARSVNSKANHRTHATRYEKAPPKDEGISTSQGKQGTQLDILILGDSNTKALKGDILYPNKSVRKELTYNLTEATEYIQHSRLPDPKVILAHVGTNDIRDIRDASKVSEGFRKFIQTSRDKYPQTSLVLSSILPRDAPTLHGIGDDVNSFLKVVGDETSFVHIVDNTNFANEGAIKSALFASDGYHINRNGIRVLAANIKRTTNTMVQKGMKNPHLWDMNIDDN
ncbi:uncharacterized protein LOC118430242 [Branchiostoma floridae]|uniref:Uncharacterized protein LOC118430242 n=1 Tax=Branchiostoma floridae TaxID=7739 RepID=A0A9J7NAJ6_BRAFL|nr:uncharacterized protein LOC118430242 [Branchiostoma floridae]